MNTLDILEACMQPTVHAKSPIIVQVPASDSGSEPQRYLIERWSVDPVHGSLVLHVQPYAVKL